MKKSLLPFLISAIISGLIMLFLLFKSGDLMPNLKFGFAPIIIPGIFFILAYGFRFQFKITDKNFAITALLMALIWLFAFGIGFNAFFIITIPIAGFGGAFALSWIGDMRHGIKIDMKGWLIGLIGAGAAVIGLGIWILANAISPEINKTVKASGIEPMGIASGAIVFLWQLAMGIILQKARVEHPVAEKIESIGDD